MARIRPTSFLGNPLFTVLAPAQDGTIRLSFGNGRTAPVAVHDVARVVATVLTDPTAHVGRTYELTGPRTVDMHEVAAEFARALGLPVTYVTVPLEQ